MRHKFKPLKAELERLRKTAGNAKGADETMLPAHGEHIPAAGGRPFHDSAVAFKLADLSKVEVGEDGTMVASQARCKSGRAQVPRSSIYAAAVTVSLDSVGTSSMAVGLNS
jgi:hypothetical protein